MEGIRTAVSTVGESLTIEVGNEPTREPLPSRYALVQLFEDPSRECNVRTTISVSTPDWRSPRPIELYWVSQRHLSECVSILAVEATQVLFLGVGRLLAVINYSTGEVLYEDILTLFWSLTHMHGSVLLRSELECCMFTEDGRLAGSVPVDPPWEESLDSDGIHFQSSVYGHAYLPWCSI